MARSEGLQVVLGAGGGTGAALVAELRQRGILVRAVTRDGRSDGVPGVEHTAADLSDPAAARRAVAGAAVVYHAANPPYRRWVEDFPGLNDAVLTACREAGARVVYADNLYMYGPDAGVMTETTPERATDKNGRLRGQLARQLLEAHARGEVDVVIGRSSDYLGPGGINSSLGETLFGPALEGKTVRWIGNPDVAHSVAYLPDMAKALVTLALADDSGGRAWHLPSVGTPTGRELVGVISAVTGTELTVQGTPRWLLRLFGLVRPVAGEIADIYYQWQAPFVSSDAAFQSAYGPFEPTPLEDAVASTVSWFRERAS